MTIARGAAGALISALLLTACMSSAPAQLPHAPVPVGPAITVQSTPVPLNPEAPAQDRLGDLIYAGGLMLTSDQTARLHGLSDLDIQPDGALVSESDEGDLFHGRVVLDAKGRLIAVTQGRMRFLSGLDGKPLPGKEEADAEGLARMANGDLLISFERDDRIWLYPADGRPPHAVPSPDVKFPPNLGMEALATDPDRGATAYIAGGESTGRTWSCTLTTTCVEGPTVPLPPTFNLVATRRLPKGRTAWLLRSYTPVTGNAVTLRVTDADGRVIEEQTLRRPLTADNFEGLAAVPGPGGKIRFYLISDDNFSPSQRTLLLAFDWTAP